MEDRQHGWRIVTAAWLAAIATAALLAFAESSLAHQSHDDVLSKRVAERAIGKSAEPAGDGLYRVRAGDIKLLTHGPDPAPPARRVAGGVFGPNGEERAPACATDYYQHILVGYIAGTPNPVEALRPTVQSAVRRMNWVLNADAIETGGTTADYKVRCDPYGQIQVDAFASPSPAFQDVVASVRAAGFDDPKADYTIFFDSTGPGGGCGIGSYRTDERLAENNVSNTGGGYGIAYQPCWFGTTPMHENAHNQGAVQYSAPQSTGTGGHCNQGYDVLCYAPDGGDRNQAALDISCADRPHFDCGGDDYFDAAPEPGEYLESHWNLGSRLNRYIAFGDSAEPTPPAGDQLGITHIRVGDTVRGLVGNPDEPAVYRVKVPRGKRSLAVRASGRGRIRLYLLRGASPDDETWDYRSRGGSTTGVRVVRPRSGKWFIGVVDSAGGEPTEFSLRTRIR